MNHLRENPEHFSIFVGLSINKLNILYWPFQGVPTALALPDGGISAVTGSLPIKASPTTRRFVCGNCREWKKYKERNEPGGISLILLIPTVF